MTIEEILQTACYDEYKANAYYQKVIDTYGDVLPFKNIVYAEVRHYTAIEGLCQKYGVAIPNNDWYDKVVIGETLEQCCIDGVNAEKANIEMYDKLLVYVQHDDIKDIFYREQAASYNQHLPAFEQCAQTYQSQNNSTQYDQTKKSQNHDIYNMFQGLMKGDVDTTKITQTLTSLGSRDVLIGIAAGAGLAMLLSSDVSKDMFSKIFNNNNEG